MHFSDKIINEERRHRSTMNTPEMEMLTAKSASSDPQLVTSIGTVELGNINEDSCQAPPNYSSSDNQQSTISQASVGLVSTSTNSTTIGQLMMDPPTVSVSSEIAIYMQSALARESIHLDTGSLTLRTLKDIACNFIDRNYPDHRLGHLTDRLLLFRHHYADQPVLLPINAVSDLTNDTVVEIVLSVAPNKNSPTEEPRPHTLSNHNYKTPTFCDHCGAMLLGLFNQGVKCENCGLNFHRKCIPLYPNNCSHSARRRRSSTNLINFGPGSSSNLTNVVNESSNSLCQDMKLLTTSPAHFPTSKSGSSSPVATPSNGQVTKFRVPHNFVTYKYGTIFSFSVCVYCKKNLLLHPSFQCKVCKLIVHSECKDFIHSNCVGEVGKSDSTSEFKGSNGGPAESKSCYDLKTQTEAQNALSIASNNTSSSNGISYETGNKNDPVEYHQLNKLSNASSNNIKLMRIVQSVKHVKRRNSKTIKEGRMIHYTNRDSTRMNYYWRLDSTTITMFKNDNTNRYHRQICLSEVDQILVAPPGTEFGMSANDFYVFEIRVGKTIYYCGDATTTAIAREWEFVIRQTLKSQTMSIQERTVPPGSNGSVTTNSNQNRAHELAVAGNSNGKNIISDEIDTEYNIFVQDLLGAGQFGQVFGGAHKSTHEEVAIKVIDKLRFPQKQEEQLKNEVSILRDIRHQGVVTLKHMYEYSTKIFVVMEKLNGDMLEMILNSPQGKLSERVTKFLISQILMALRYLHSQHICHCDLKPENVLLSSNCEFPQVKLCDFGFARIIGEKSFRRSVVGTPAYLAPEVLKNKGYNKSLDMWSVGVIIYVSLSGTFPFHEEEEIQDQIQNASFMYPQDPWENISRKAIALISNLLQVQCSKRLTVEKSLGDPWLNDYVVWCDLRKLEKEVGTRWLTHESDEMRWEKYRIDHNLPEPDFGPIVSNNVFEQDNDDETRDRFALGSSFQRPYRIGVNTQEHCLVDNSRL